MHPKPPRTALTAPFNLGETSKIYIWLRFLNLVSVWPGHIKREFQRIVTQSSTHTCSPNQPRIFVNTAMPTQKNSI